MEHIISNIFLGDWNEASELTDNDKFEIFTVAANSPFKGHHVYKITEDDNKQNYTLFHNAITDIAIIKSMYPNARVLIHCSAGMSRSPAVMIGYMIKYNGLSFNEAKAFVKDKMRIPRLIINPHLEQMLIEIDDFRIQTIKAVEIFHENISKMTDEEKQISLIWLYKTILWDSKWVPNCKEGGIR